MGEVTQLLRVGQHTLLDQVVENVAGSKVTKQFSSSAETIKERTAILYSWARKITHKTGGSFCFCGADSAVLLR
jgi:hypothetical protein